MGPGEAGTPRRTGRRGGSPDTRGAILAAARTAFAARGFAHASVRAIAADAGVDPALVHHYFGTKAQLFRAVLDFPVDPAQLLGAVLGGDPDTVGVRLVHTVLGVWDSPAGAAAVALLRSALSDQGAARLVQEFLLRQVFGPVREALGIDGPDAALRTGLVVTQVAGLVVLRHLLRWEPVASTSPDALAAAVGPTVQRYLTGEVDASPS